MELNPETVDAVLFPTAIYHDRVRGLGQSPQAASNAGAGWQQSRINPASRIDSLATSPGSTWVVDGMDAYSRSLWAYPTSARDSPPSHVDVRWGEGSFTARARQDLCPEKAFLVDGSRHRSLEFSQHIVRALELWSRGLGPSFEQQYAQLPFGSQIAIHRIETDVRRMQISFVRDYGFEKQWLSTQELQSLSLAPDSRYMIPASAWPSIISITQLSFRRRLQDAVSLVAIEGTPEGQLLVFKAAKFDSKTRYDEILKLLALEPHPNVQPRPLFIVEKQVRFGGKRGVCGYLTSYHGAGSLTRFLTYSAYASEPPSLAIRLRLAREVTEGLIHIRDSVVSFHPDLTADNILLVSADGATGSTQASNLHAQIIDFEAATPWLPWTPPEVYYVDCLDRLARVGSGHDSQNEIEATLLALVPDWAAPDHESRYSAVFNGITVPWRHLSVPERHSATTYMLGRLLWCILEAVPGARSPATPGSVFIRPGSPNFPHFQQTPPALRECIRLCTTGALEWQRQLQPFEFQGVHIVPGPDRGQSSWGTMSQPRETTIEQLQREAREWWAGEVDVAKAFVSSRIANVTGRAGGFKIDFMADRPSLEDVLKAIQIIVREHEVQEQIRVT